MTIKSTVLNDNHEHGAEQMTIKRTDTEQITGEGKRRRANKQARVNNPKGINRKQ